ncbi:hypothetical protein FQZ97_1172880 [compost metagenome]
MVWLPVLRESVEGEEAVPPATGTGAPRLLPSTVNCTVPVGSLLPLTRATWAVNETASPWTTEAGGASVVVDGFLPTTNALEALDPL